jgi:hypothetical protein
VERERERERIRARTSKVLESEPNQEQGLGRKGYRASKYSRRLYLSIPTHRCSPPNSGH